MLLNELMEAKMKEKKRLENQRVSGSNPESELGIMIQFAAAFYTTEQIHFRFQKSKTVFFYNFFFVVSS